MTARNPDGIAPVDDAALRPPRRQIAFSVGKWRVTYAGPDPRSPRTGAIAGRPEFGPGGARVPVIADDGPAALVHWVDERDIIAVAAQPAGERPVRGRPEQCA
ncbi:hypothetical protein AMES_5522 [Amycolatopsis mediterranei S699]|uniref:Uncharacterized protein n=2 Tax=Amycolatopsis mediterranei TaxID=33910 RepID=A0A0H3DAR3_AMYMU|nr:hypothetical protein [Amycolatopsis mediterranei]ADJ47347.1 hypothetical protein AMED_5593 [Amycolatopsis mediterranei U32]AEK44182.1 hypothetical protein RAM_28525 [Amycolatopsis mediterranei S699]AFO79058.1 hypothetical protein AMES_5522 [Amycolatopsis mediterranei S699]AGT86186.1 hypothetical protein B737_5522 [Amycolatopsis mediterranei RB]KDO12468.1 hypothetical protein DV26_02110 [Amycolatopsis mediterranei]